MPSAPGSPLAGIQYTFGEITVAGAVLLYADASLWAPGSFLECRPSTGLAGVMSGVRGSEDQEEAQGVAGEMEEGMEMLEWKPREQQLGLCGTLGRASKNRGVPYRRLPACAVCQVTRVKRTSDLSLGQVQGHDLLSQLQGH